MNINALKREMKKLEELWQSGKAPWKGVGTNCFETL